MLVISPPTKCNCNYPALGQFLHYLDNNYGQGTMGLLGFGFVDDSFFIALFVPGKRKSVHTYAGELQGSRSVGIIKDINSAVSRK